MKNVQQPLRAVGYCRVSTDGQGERGFGLAAQQEVIDAEAAHRGWLLLDTYIDVASGKSTKNRNDLAKALAVLEDGEADVLVVAKLDRISRSLVDFASIMQTSRRQGWAVAALDLGIDTSTTNGELIANMIMSLAQWERRVIGERTKDALAQVRANGTKLGRPVTVGAGTADTIKVLRLDGRSYHSIAKTLNANGVPTGQGGSKWYPSSVRSVFERVTANS